MAEKTITDRTIEFKVSGMRCADCAARVREAAAGVPRVQAVLVDLKTGRATVRVDADFTDIAAIDRAIGREGYRVDRSPTHRRAIEFRISGAEDETGAEQARQALAALDGVIEARVEPRDGRATVEVAPEFDRVAALDGAVRRAGFTTDLDPRRFEFPKRTHEGRDQPGDGGPATHAAPADVVQLRIGGMNCASCVVKIESALAKLDGVRDVEVNFGTQRAVVTLDGSGSHARALLGAVRHAGYGAEIIGDLGPIDAAQRFQDQRRQAEREIEGWRRQCLGAGAASIAILLTRTVPGAGWVHAVLATGIQAWAGRMFYRGAWRGARAGAANMDTLIALSTTAAWGYGLGLLSAGGAAGHQFMTATMLLTFVSLGKWLEGRGRIKAGRALGALLELAPSVAHRVEGEKTLDVDTRSLRPGDRCRILRGERIPADGRLESAAAEIDESMLTGESLPVSKTAAEAVYGGTVNVGEAMTIGVEKVGEATALNQIARRVEQAQNTRPKMQALADRAAAVFVPAVMAVAAVAFAIGWRLDLGWGEALLRAIAVLIVACPCALGLATPMAVMAGVGVAARRGIIVRSARELEVSGSVQTVVFDKTGTLTAGTPEVTALMPAGDHEEHELLDAAASLEAEAPHPLAEAILSHAREKGILPRPLGGVETIVGEGVRSSEPPLALGSVEFLESLNVQTGELPEEAARRQNHGETLVAVGRPAGELIGVIALADRIKPGALEAVENLRAEGLKTTLISGDSPAATAAVAALLRIDDFQARVKPGEKADAVRDLQRRGQVVAMVGDGINDAPALAQADLGIAMASGSDIAQEAAGLVLLGGDPRQVGQAITLARRVRAKMIQNLGWAFVYNLALIPLAAFGILEPIYASAAMAASSVSVVGNALLLYRVKP